MASCIDCIIMPGSEPCKSCDFRKENKKRMVQLYTNCGYYVWQIADKLGISEAEVVKLQGRSF